MPKKELVREMFDGIAPAYDRLNHLLSLGADRTWRRRSLRGAVSSDSPQNILDLACGTGDFTLEIARKMHPESHVTSVDISLKMLEVMERKLLENKIGNKVSIVTAPAEILPFPDNSFQLASIAFGIRNFEDREKGLREMLRVLRPGGRVVILELSVPENRFIRWGYNLYFLHILPLIGGSVSGDKAAYKYLPASVVNFPKHKDFMETMRAAGFARVHHKAFTFGICRMFTGVKA